MRVLCNSLSFSFEELEVFEGFNMEFPEKIVTAVLGPSGCGKTTLLNLISGVIEPDSGSVKLERQEGREEEPGTQEVSGDGDRSEVRDKSGRIGYLFQEPRLLPWKTVRRNVEIVLERVYDRKERRKCAEEFLCSVGLGDFLEYYPFALSGGMRQRVAIARAFAYPADLMLLDEPFQALDLRLKLNLSTLFIGLWENDPRTTVFVTHDIQEALILGDRIVVLSERPAQPVGEFENPLEVGRRSLSDPQLGDLERELYGLLTDLHMG